MKKNSVRIASILIVAAMMLSFASCGAANSGDPITILVSLVYEGGKAPAADQTLADPTPADPTPADPTPVDPTQTPGDATATTAAGGDATQTTAAGGSETPASGLPTGNASILAKYTEVMDKLKTDKPAYNKKEWQELPADKLNIGNSTVTKILTPIIDKYITGADECEEQINEKGTDMKWVPVCNTQKGCLLTDVSAIKSASATQDGANVKIVITLNDEANPEPAAENATSAPSKVGGMFNPLSKASIDAELAKISAVKVNSFSLVYTGCTATLVYNPTTNQVISLDQVSNIDIKANISVLVTIEAAGYLINTMKMYNIKY